MPIVGHTLVYVELENFDFGVIGTDSQGLVCHVCFFGSHSCCHVNALKRYIKNSLELPDYLQDFLGFVPGESSSHSYVLKAETRVPIPWKSTASQRAIFCCDLEVVISTSNGRNYLPTGVLYSPADLDNTHNNFSMGMKIH